ncbi:uncharacterized protein [Dysidea avara]|uniref:uncharacterized protein n=1 Tax=Dysidea avara TaxID=196820 RepID=UPI0033218D55
MNEVYPATVKFLNGNLATTLKGWKEICDHLEKVLGKCEIHKGHDSDEYTLIQYESLTIKIYGKITVNDTLTTLSMWEYYHIIEYANKISLQVQAATIQYQQASTTYQFGLVEKGPWKPLRSDNSFEDTIIWLHGCHDKTDVELFNGCTNLYLQVHKEGTGYKVHVADRPLETDPLSRFDLSDPNGTIRLVADRNCYLKFDSTNHLVLADNTGDIDAPRTSEFHFAIDIL